MAGEFNTISSKDLKDLRNFYRRAPYKFGAVMNATLNTLAFTTRENIITTLDKHLVIRARKFVEGSVRVNTARGGKHVSSAGSIERKRFSGWVEQQTGGRSGVDRSPTLAARNENFSRKMSAKSRLKRQTSLLKITDIKNVGHRKARTHELFRQAKKSKRPFIIRKRDVRKVRINKRMAAGLYQFKRGELLRTQTFGEPQDPKQFDWIGEATRMTFKSHDFMDTFDREFVRMANRTGINLR